MKRTRIPIALIPLLFSSVVLGQHPNAELLSQLKPMTLPIMPVPRPLNVPAPSCPGPASAQAMPSGPIRIDAHGNSAAATSGSLRKPELEARPRSSVTVTSSEVAASTPTSGCTPPPAKSQFSVSDTGNIYVFTSVTGASVGDAVHWEWDAPDGTVSFTSDLTSNFSGIFCFWTSAAVSDAAKHPGTWTVKVSYNGSLLVTVNFSISGSSGPTTPIGGGCSSIPGKICRDEISLFYQGAHSLGTAWVRMVFEDTVPTTLAVTQVQNSLNNLISGLNAVPCVHYNTSKISTLRDAIPSMLSADIVNQVGALIPDIQSAVQNASLSCSNGANFVSLYVVGVNLGASIAEAIGFVYFDPLSSAAQAFITAEVSAASAAMASYVPCSNGFSPTLLLPSNFDLANPAVLVPLSQLIGTYNLIVWNISLSCCCCNCSAT